ncbi:MULTISPECIES: alpha/beta fold hydrolase [unclassified Crossiella]|uniref:alpha/beta fold hydrolase n=1 Tax=unclassified Crossiella TaxID=2620835 RepID=UPI001FFF17E2|nr:MULTISPECIES: alpha/beta hydrolase [unclassified Crossiella]MCK2238015.1 alpha/beta hydrolase [Crossiella sp. S99.2]MCK2255298.1 alpha/beta hydrolase [Crossiella sp. S99.1]
MTEVRANNLTFHVQPLATPETRPDAPLVVFLHGLVVDNLSGLYLTLATPAATAGARTLCYDLRGHGRSERPPTGYTLDDSVTDLHALLDALGEHRPVRLVGNSYGGLLALAFAAHCPDRVEKIMLIESLVPTPGWGERMADTLTDAAAGAFDHNFTHMTGRKWDRTVNQVEQLIGHTSMVSDMGGQEPFSPERYATVSMPVLAVYGSESELLPEVSVLQKYLPQLELEILPEQSHMLLTRATGLVREVLARWLR